MKRIATLNRLLLAAVLLLVLVASLAGAQYATKVYMEQGGNTLQILPGGTIEYNNDPFNVARGVQSVTGTAYILTGLDSTVYAAGATLESVGAAAGDPAVVTVVKSSTTAITVTVKQDDFATNAANAVNVNWWAIGQ